MKDVKMNKSNPLQNRFCQVCNEPLIFVPHYEYDGVTEHGSFEPYWECPRGCMYPDCADSELTAEELMTRGKVDTGTEYGIVTVQNWSRKVVIL